MGVRGPRHISTALTVEGSSRAVARGRSLESILAATNRLQFNGGFGSDHLTKFDFVPVDLNRNTGEFTNSIVQFTSELAASFEYRHLVTRPFEGALRINHHVDVGIAYSFLREILKVAGDFLLPLCATLNHLRPKGETCGKAREGQEKSVGPAR
jgi:hypothetical protein